MSEKNVTVVAEMKAKLGKEAELKENLIGLLHPTHQEEGCINYDMHQSAEDSSTFLFYENWTSKEALDQHLAMPHLKAFFAKTPDLIDGEVKISLWDKVSY